MTKRSWIRNLFTRPATRPIRKAPPRARLAVEALEDRTVPSTFTVLNTLDDIYRFAVEQTAMARGETLEIMIVLILIFELVLFFMGIMK